MLNVTRNCYRQSVTDSDSNVTQNAYANSNSVKLQRSNLLCCVLLRLTRCVNDTEPAKNTGFYGENIVFYKTSGRRTRGIVELVHSTVDTFLLRRSVLFLAHHFAFTFLNFEKRQLLWCESGLKIRVSAVRFCPRPPDTPHSFAKGCGVFLWGSAESHAAYAVPTCHTLWGLLNDAHSPPRSPAAVHTPTRRRTCLVSPQPQPQSAVSVSLPFSCTVWWALFAD